MAEATEQSPSPAPDSSNTPQSLDEVYKAYNVDVEAQSFNPQRDQVQQQPPAKQEAIPDPVLDPNGYRDWQGKQSQFVQQSLSSLHGELTQMRAERVKAREEADIKSAVQKFRSVTGDEVDEDIAEIAMGQRARKDPKFLAVYNNRSKNPQAWNAAVTALAGEYKSKSSMKIDSQIAENQRAAKLSIGSQTKTQKDEPTGVEATLAGKSGKDFDRAWRNLVDNNY